MIHLMLDLETLDVLPTAAIAQVGLCAFSPEDGTVGDPAIICVDPADCVRLGMTVSVSTFLWWLGQDDASRAAMARPLREIGVAPVPLPVALGMVAQFANNAGARYVWSHGATFDVVIMEHAHRVCGYPLPWHHYDVRDTRTLFGLAEPDWPENPAKHRADADARAQAGAVCSSYRKLGLAR